MDHDDLLEGAPFSRREALTIATRAGLGLTMGGTMLAAARNVGGKPPAPAMHLIAAPTLAMGPFSVEEGIQRANLLAGSRRPSVVNAVPLVLDFRIHASSDGERFVPLMGAQVDVWHVDALGVYSDAPLERDAGTTCGQSWLIGYQRTRTDGRVLFRTVFPGWYEGRTTHVHFKVRYMIDRHRHASFTSQLFVPDALADAIYDWKPYRPRPLDAVRNRDDAVFRNGIAEDGHLGSVLTLEPKPDVTGHGYVARYNIAFLTPHSSQGRAYMG